MRLVVALAVVALGSQLIGMRPARALPPTVTSFLPISGPPGTSVIITGLGFQDLSPATAVAFNGAAATFTIDSIIQITATVPAGATTGPIAVTDSEGSGTSLISFTVSPPTQPVVASFLPLSGPVGTSVTLTGTGFAAASSVRFNGTAAIFTVVSNLQITTTVPTGATTGPITVTTPGGGATSAAPFTVTGAGPVDHNRTLTLQLRATLVARGKVSSADGFAACVNAVMVKIQRRGPRGWKTVGSDLTSTTGRFSDRIGDRAGRYRAIVPKISLNGAVDVCGRAVSPIRRNR